MTLMAQRMFEAYNKAAQEEKLNMKTEIMYMGQVCQCFGKLEENSNFEMAFEDETLDAVWCDGDIINDKAFETWEDVVIGITNETGPVPLQLIAV